MDIQEDAVEVECRLCNNMVYNLPEHPKKSSDKHVKCYKCRDEFPKQFITAHAKNAQLERKKTERTKTTMTTMKMVVRNARARDASSHAAFGNDIFPWKAKT